MRLTALAAVLGAAHALTGKRMAELFGDEPKYTDVWETASMFTFDLGLGDVEPDATSALYLVLKAFARNKRLDTNSVVDLVEHLIDKHGASPVAKAGKVLPFDAVFGMASHRNLHLLLAELLAPIHRAGSCGDWDGANELLRWMLAYCNDKAVAEFITIPCLKPVSITELVHAISPGHYGEACKTGYELVGALATDEQLRLAVSLPWASSWQFNTYTDILTARSVDVDTEATTRKAIRMHFDAYARLNSRRVDNPADYNWQQSVFSDVGLSSEEMKTFVQLALRYSPNLDIDAPNLLAGVMESKALKLDDFELHLPDAKKSLKLAALKLASTQSAVGLYRLFEAPDFSTVTIDDPSPTSPTQTIGAALIAKLAEKCTFVQVNLLESVPQKDWQTLFAVYATIGEYECRALQKLNVAIASEVQRVAKERLGGDETAQPFANDDIVGKYEQLAEKEKVVATAMDMGREYIAAGKKRVCHLLIKALEQSALSLLDGLCKGIEAYKMSGVIKTVCGDAVLEAAQKAKVVPRRKIEKLYGIEPKPGTDTPSPPASPLPPSDSEGETDVETPEPSPPGSPSLTSSSSGGRGGKPKPGTPGGSFIFTTLGGKGGKPKPGPTGGSSNSGGSGGTSGGRPPNSQSGRPTVRQRAKVRSESARDVAALGATGFIAVLALLVL